jgi:hypothetical protein
MKVQDFRLELFLSVSSDVKLQYPKFAFRQKSQEFHCDDDRKLHSCFHSQ